LLFVTPSQSCWLCFAICSSVASDIQRPRQVAGSFGSSVR
jgi:hypothetical protein